MLRIRFMPAGRKRQITYRIVVAEKRSKLKGEPVEDLGWFNPKLGEVEIDEERVRYWIEKGGAQPSDRVHNLFIEKGVIEGDKKSVHSKKKVSEEEMKEDEVSKKETDEDLNEEEGNNEESDESDTEEKSEDKEGSKEESTDEESSPDESSGDKEEDESKEEAEDVEEEKKE